MKKSTVHPVLAVVFLVAPCSDQNNLSEAVAYPAPVPPCTPKEHTGVAGRVDLRRDARAALQSGHAGGESNIGQVVRTGSAQEML